MVETGLAAEFLPELPALALEQDPIHRHKDVLAHTLAVVDKTSPDRLLRLAALLHDIGKPRTRAFGPAGVTFHHHEVVGARMARDRMTALRYSREDIDIVTRLVELHLRFHTYRLGWTDRAVRRYVRDAGPLLDRLNELDALRLHHAQRGQGPGARAAAWTSSSGASRSCGPQEELDSIRPELDGRQVMEHLGLAPGPGGRRGARVPSRAAPRGRAPRRGRGARRLDDWWSEKSSRHS